MKKFAIFCDGTWQSLRNPQPTNVVKLARSVAATSAAGDPQPIYYDEGVGVGSNVSRITDALTRWIGGAFGRGLDAKIEHAYRFLVLNYEPGDEIYVFGFSRGAYTARSLCGLIRKCGILRRDCFGVIPEAMRRYRDAVHPDDPDMIDWRGRHTYDLATGTQDQAALGVSDAAAAAARATQQTRAQLYQYRPQSYRIAFAGIWDTVGSMGIPRRFDPFGIYKRHQFHDLRGSSLVSSIRHAVAANEQREFFDVTPYENIDALNVGWAEATGWNCTDPLSGDYVPYALRPYQQRWFPGDHGSVGGGNEDDALSNLALRWIAEGARWAGLTFSDEQDLPLAQALGQSVPAGGLGRHGAIALPKGPTRAAGPDAPDEISDEAWTRWRIDPAYRPANLLRWLPERTEAAPAPPAFPAA
jgi:uncharacterized protein (DUF2235 family)